MAWKQRGTFNDVDNTNEKTVTHPFFLGPLIPFISAHTKMVQVNTILIIIIKSEGCTGSAIIIKTEWAVIRMERQFLNKQSQWYLV